MSKEDRQSPHGKHLFRKGSDEATHLDVIPSGRQRQRAFSCVKTTTEYHGEPIRPRTLSMPTAGYSGRALFPNLSHRHRGLTTSIPDHESDFYTTIRMFEVNSKGVIKKRSDSWRSRSSASFSSEGEPGLVCYSPLESSSSIDSVGCAASDPTPGLIVLVLGEEGVGKTALTQQFMTSEYLGGFDTSSGKLCPVLTRCCMESLYTFMVSIVVSSVVLYLFAYQN